MSAARQLELWPEEHGPHRALGTFQSAQGHFVCHRWIAENRYAFGLGPTQEAAEQQAEEIAATSLAVGRET